MGKEGPGNRDAVVFDAFRSTDDELRPVTALFADVVGSTSLGERLSLPEVKAVIGECVNRMCEAVEAFGGRVGAYMGDGIAAFFGLDSTREDDIERGARAALEIKKVVAAYSDEVREAWGVQDFNVRIGLNSGRVATGKVGAGDPQQLALGDPVNVAARLQSAASPGTILVGLGIAQALDGRFALKELGQTRVRGRSEPVQAFELQGPGESRPRTLHQSFVGRATELAAVETVLVDLGAGRGQVCIVIGDAGLGKTRLLSELRLRAPSDTLWLEGQCDRIDNRLPFGPFVEAFRAWLGIDDRCTAIETRVKLRSKVGELFGEDLDERAAYLARLAGVALEQSLDRRLDGLPPDVLMGGLFKAYVHWLAALADRSPVVLAIDNFGFAGPSSIEMAIRLFDAIEQAPVLLLLTMRPEPNDPGWSVRMRALDELAHRSQELRLRPFTHNESELLVAELDREGNLDARLREVVIQRSEGNPLYIEELLAAITSDQANAAIENGLPAPLESLLLARIDALTPEAKLVLQAAAILGRTFARDVISGMRIAPDVEAAIAELLRADVIRERSRRPARFVFKHGLVREAALATLPPTRLAALNAQAAAALQSWSEFDELRDAEGLVRHYFACGDDVRAVAYLESLAERLAMVYRYEEACDLLMRCLAEARRFDFNNSYKRIARKLADLLALRGLTTDAIALLDELMQVVSDRVELLELLLSKATWLRDVGRYVEANEIVARCLDESRNGPVLRSRFLILQGMLAISRQDIDRAARSVEDLGDPSELPPGIKFDAAVLISGVLATRGELVKAETWALQAQAIADSLGQTASQLLARRILALVLVLKGCMAEAHELLRYAYGRYREIGFVTGQLESAINLIYVSRLAGSLAESVQVADQVLRLAEGPMWSGFWLGTVAHAKFEQRKLAEAREIALQIVALGAQCDSSPRIAARVVLGMCAAAEGEWDSAEVELAAAELEAESDGWAREKVEVWAMRAEVARLKGDSSRVLDCVDVARSTVFRPDAILDVSLRRLEGWALAHQGKRAGLATLRSALDAARQIGLRIEEGDALVALGAVDRERSAEWFRQAEEVFDACGCGRGLAELAATRARTLSSAAT